MTDCIFCKIVAGEIPSHKIYEDEYTFAFLDIGPVSKGHCLVIPKEHADRFSELSEKSAQALGSTLRKVSQAVEQAFSCDFNLLNNNGQKANQAVHHVHFHIIPRRGDDDEFSFDWNAGDIENAQELIDAITSKLK